MELELLSEHEMIILFCDTQGQVRGTGFSSVPSGNQACTIVDLNPRIKGRVGFDSKIRGIVGYD